MFNRSGISKVSGAGPVQILANVELQESVGCIVSQAIVPDADAEGKKIAKAGTPIRIDYMNLQTPAVAASSSSKMNAVLLHDVDVTSGNANGTALIFGFVNVNRVDSTTAGKITTALTQGNESGVTFIKA